MTRWVLLSFVCIYPCELKKDIEMKKEINVEILTRDRSTDAY